MERRSLLLGLVAALGHDAPCFVRRAAAQPVPTEPEAQPATGKPIEGFRRARFGMSEAELRQAIREDFPAAATRLSRVVHPRERTTVLSVTADDLVPEAGPARISYILGAASKRLAQVNILWTSDGVTPARDEAIVAAANTLRDLLASTYAAEELVTNRQLSEDAILVLRAAQVDGRMVLLMLSGVGAAGRQNRASGQPPLTMQLSYIRDHRHPDVFRIERGRF